MLGAPSSTLGATGRVVCAAPPHLLVPTIVPRFGTADRGIRTSFRAVQVTRRPLTPSGLRLEERLHAIAASLDRLAEKRG